MADKQDINEVYKTLHTHDLQQATIEQWPSEVVKARIASIDVMVATLIKNRSVLMSKKETFEANFWKEEYLRAKADKDYFFAEYQDVNRVWTKMREKLQEFGEEFDDLLWKMDDVQDNVDRDLKPDYKMYRKAEEYKRKLEEEAIELLEFARKAQMEKEVEWTQNQRKKRFRAWMQQCQARSKLTVEKDKADKKKRRTL